MHELFKALETAGPQRVYLIKSKQKLIIYACIIYINIL